MPPRRREDLQQEIGKSLSEQCVLIRQRRRQIEDNWLKNHAIWSSLGHNRTFLGEQTSVGRYDIPTVRKSIERTIVRGVKMLTPNVRWFETLPLGNIDDKQLSNINSFMWYIIRKKIKSKSNISQLVRCMCMYGRAHLKTSIKVTNGQIWPCQRVVDPFSFYIFPETATDFSDATMIFEDVLISYEKYQTYVGIGLVDDIKRSDLGKPEWPYHMIDRLSHQGITDPTQEIATVRDKIRGDLDRSQSGFVSATELWLEKEDKLMQVYLVWNVKNGPKCVGFIESEYDHPLYRTATHRALPGESYTNSMFDDIAPLEDLANDQLNMFDDTTRRERGVGAIDLGQMARTDMIKLGGMDFIKTPGPPEDILKFFTPNLSSTNQLRAWQIYMGMINAGGGTGTLAEGQPGRNMPRAGGAMTNLINLQLADIEDIAQLLEQETLTPGLGDIYKVSDQFIPESQVLLIPGAQSAIGSGKSSLLKREQIVGDYEFEWVGALQFQDEQVRAQRLMIFLQMAFNPQSAQQLAQQGYAFNLVELVQTIWRYGLGERGLSKILIPVNELQQEMMMQQMRNNQGKQGGQNGSNGPLGYTLPSPTDGFIQQQR